MKKVKSYTSIWNVEKVIYAINDLQLPFPVTFTQMTSFILSLFTVMMLSNLPPLSLIEGAFFKYLGIPVFITWFMSQKTFNGHTEALADLVGENQVDYRYFVGFKLILNKK
ncbi:conjugal transfer protein [Carnobacterium maltaromaticum]|uniref:conjugal transfer protein n=1 Tax=Carnobacterium maltaromaticum TaxID=2751 RepID=UPI0039B0205D